MRFCKPMLSLTLVSTFAAACAPAAPPPPDVAAIRSSIEATNKRFSESIVKGDTSFAAGVYADDAILMNPNEPAWRGKAAIVKGYAGMLASVKISAFSAKTEDVMVSGDLAVETGAGEWTFTPPKGKPMTDKVKYLTVWKKQTDGSWKVVRDINNSDLPAAK